MTDRLMDLALRRAELLAQLRDVEADIVKELKTGAAEETQPANRAAPPVRRQGPGRPSTKTKKTPARNTRNKRDSNGSTNRPASLKEVVQKILGRNQRGMELRDIVREVTRMKEAGEYSTTAKSITAVVSQAINQLKQEKLIDVGKSEANRSLYMLVNRAA